MGQTERPRAGSGGRCFSEEEAGWGWSSQPWCHTPTRELRVPAEGVHRGPHKCCAGMIPPDRRSPAVLPSRSLGLPDPDPCWPVTARRGQTLLCPSTLSQSTAGGSGGGSSFSMPSPASPSPPKAPSPGSGYPCGCLRLSPRLPRSLPICGRDTRLLPPGICVPPGSPCDRTAGSDSSLGLWFLSYFSTKGAINCSLFLPSAEDNSQQPP